MIASHASSTAWNYPTWRVACPESLFRVSLNRELRADLHDLGSRHAEILADWRCITVHKGENRFHDARQSFMVCARHDCVMTNVVHHIKGIAGEAALLRPLY